VADDRSFAVEVDYPGAWSLSRDGWPDIDTGHEVDVLALARGSRPRTPGASVAFIGEAKYRDRQPGLGELRRLEHVRDMLTAAGHDARAALLGLFSGTGFTQELGAEAADSRGKILLAGLDTLYGLHGVAA
jgi:uncharacterized protein